MQVSRRSAVGLVVMNTLAAACSVRGQQTMPMPQQPSHNMPDISGRDPSADANATAMTERMRVSAEKAHDEDRRKRMLADADKLLALSTELKGYIEKAGLEELSVNVIRKAAEIEKLAHDVQQRMKN